MRIRAYLKCKLQVAVCLARDPLTSGKFIPSVQRSVWERKKERDIWDEMKVLCGWLHVVQFETQTPAHDSAMSLTNTNNNIVHIYIPGYIYAYTSLNYIRSLHLQERSQATIGPLKLLLENFVCCKVIIEVIEFGRWYSR